MSRRAPSVATEEWETSVGPAKKGIRIAMFIIDGFLILTGVILVALGVVLNLHVRTTLDADTYLPPIWALGLLPTILGFLGMLCVAKRSKKWVFAWLLCCGVCGVAGFVYFVVTRFLDPSLYGINLQIYGHCAPRGRTDTVCKCTWEEDKSHVGLLPLSCDRIRHTTNLYMSIVFIFILSISATMICVVLGCVLTFCLKLCAPKEERMIELHTTLYGANLQLSPPVTRLVKKSPDVGRRSKTVMFDTEYFLVSHHEDLLLSVDTGTEQDSQENKPGRRDDSL